MKQVCVFCGSSRGNKPIYIEAAEELGRILAERNFGLVYGGANVGTMAAVAKSALKHGGKVIGVIPRELVEREVALTELDDLRIVDSMHERKALMHELSDAFIALPGGLGTIEEVLEVFTWAQLEMHSKPCGLLNIANFYDKLVEFLEHVVSQSFIHPDNLKMILMDKDPQKLLDKFATYTPPKVDKAQWTLEMAEG
ncbi:MAG: TIGR00730 family Rossman fold protein [bacterium]|nr:TIGR00730 family Rossman fold protein [bacterium]